MERSYPDLNDRGLKIAVAARVAFRNDEVESRSRSDFEALLDAKLEQVKLSLLDWWDFEYKREEQR